MLGIIQNDVDSYNERLGEIVGWIVGVLLLIAAIVWLVKRSRKG
jgi:flagellar biogenesis protein FliO